MMFTTHHNLTIKSPLDQPTARASMIGRSLGSLGKFSYYIVIKLTVQRLCGQIVTCMVS